MYRTRKSGFTLDEILIVVIILGILAAIVIPQFTNASQDARKSNMASQVQTLKSQIELFKLQHHDKAPDISANWDVFTKCTDDVSNISNAANPVLPDTTVPFGPYMQAEPSNPLTNSSAGAALGSPDGSHGWTYDATTGVIHGIAVASDGTTYHETDDGVRDASTQVVIP
jgi:general secretion pathway protein G